MTQEEINNKHQQLQELKRNLTARIEAYIKEKQARIDAYKAEERAKWERENITDDYNPRYDE